MIHGALRLVSLALAIVLIAIVASAGYSGYQEYRALSSLAGSSSNIQGSLNGTNFTLTGINVPNNMSYPLSLSIFGQVMLEHSSIGNFTTGKQMIAPGQTRVLSVSIGLNFTRALESNSSLLQEILFNQTTLSVNTTLSASIVPLLGLNLTSSANQTIGPALQNLSVSFATSGEQLSADQSELLVPLVATWSNETPLSFNGTLEAFLTGIPGQPTGNYGSGAGLISVKALSGNSAQLTLGIPVSSLQGEASLPSGNYELQFTLNLDGTLLSFNRIVTL